MNNTLLRLWIRPTPTDTWIASDNWTNTLGEGRTPSIAIEDWQFHVHLLDRKTDTDREIAKAARLIRRGDERSVNGNG